jgi:ABC-type multidrug transport system ATPase subunit
VQVLNLDRVQIKYGSRAVVTDISFAFGPGKVCGLLGPNGAGKTTLLKGILGLTPIFSGQISISGILHSNKKSRERLAYLPDEFNYFTGFKVKHCLKFFAKSAGRNVSEAEIAENLQRFELQDLLSQSISKLSKGQKQRVGFAAILMRQPKIVLLDEPFNGLDPIAMDQMNATLQELRANGCSVLLNSHNLSEVSEIADRIIILNRGRVEADDEAKNIENIREHFLKTIKGST